MSRGGVTNFLQLKYFGAKRRVLARIFPVGTHHHVLNEYPKSGGSWIGEMFSDAVQLRFPRNGNSVLSRSLIHGHFMNPIGLNGSIVVWRDGRDVMTSSYYYYTREAVPIADYLSNHDLVARTRKRLARGRFAGKPGESAQDEFSRFLRMMLLAPVYPSLTWPQFVRTWAPREKCHHVKYEDFKRDTHGSLQSLVRSAAGINLSDARTEEIVAQHSFFKQSGRQEGSEDPAHFLRKGIIGDWKNHFSSDDLSFFLAKSGREIELLGYEI